MNFTFTEKQDLAIMLNSEIKRLGKELEKLPKRSKKISVIDKLNSYPSLIARHRETLNKLNN